DVGTVDCETVVTLWAENYCNIVQGGPSQATFNPIRIWDLDDPSISASATLLCYPDTVVTFMNTTEMNCYFQGNIYQRYEYWNFGDYWNLGYDSIVDWTPWPPTFPHTIAFPGIGTYSIEMADSNFCGIVNTAITIEIVPPPIADIDISDDTVCVGTPITFFQQATGDANVYKWNFNNGMGWISTGTGNLTFTYNTPGTYYVQSMVAVSGASSSCSDTTGVTVVVLPNPTVNIIPDITEACDQLDVNFTQVSSGATQWNWTFEGTPSSWDGPSPPVISFNTPGQYDITLTVVGSNGCPGNDTEQVTVHASPQAAILVNNLCEGDSAHFFDASTSELYSPITSWDWNFGDGETSDETNPVHFYDNTGFYDITLVVGNGLCSDSVTQTVEVVPAPVADIGLDNATGCSPLEVQYSNNTTGAVSYLWNFGDGSSSSDVAPNHVYYNNDGIDTTYIVSFVATNSMGCASYDTLLVAPLPNAVAAYSDNTSVPGCSPYEAVFDNNSTGASTYLWTFGNGASSTLENPVYLYFNNTPFVQYFDVTLYAYATNGCHDTTSHTVTVFPLPIFDFDISPSSGCAPLNVTMPFLSGAVNYFWDFGDGTTSSLPAPTHQYQNNTLFPVIYDVTLTATSPFGCTGTSTSEVIVNPAPMAQFGISQLSGCSPLQVNLTNLSISADYYDWDYGDGSSSSEISLIHSHTFVNNGSNVQVFDITLTAHTNDGCAHIFTQSVEVWPAASASFVVPAPQCAPATLYFDNTSSNAVAYDWDFGNGLQSTAENPSSYYINSTDAPVQFDVTLSVVSSYGCTAMVTQQVTLWDTPDVDFLLSDPALCSPAPVELINLSTNADAYVWNYGDSQTSNTADSVHVHLFQQYMSGVTNYTISLTATTAQGCSATTTAPFTLYPEVEAQFMVDTTGCSPHNAAFINQSEGAISYEWNFGDGQQSSAVNPMNIYTTSSIVDTSFYSSLVATNTYGCTDTALATIHVFHAPLAIAQVDSSSGCHPLDVFFANNSIGADSYVWNYGNGLTSTVADSIHLHTFYNATPSVYTYNVTLQAYTVNG
ncbi:MAG: PKD domain-containing protein, partial [Flavobacteriales bacterium]|nr:PKD domain-containing protein [Flavobacteriales bacterium]